jgi:hypothetical protein
VGAMIYSRVLFILARWRMGPAVRFYQSVIGFRLDASAETRQSRLRDKEAQPRDHKNLPTLLAAPAGASSPG